MAVMSQLMRAPGVKASVAVAVAAALFGVGFYLGAWFERQRVPDDPEPGPLPINLGSDVRYVAIGDSYSAGEGLEPWVDGTQDVRNGGDRCHRSRDFAYPVRLTFVPPVEVNFRACSGAKVRDVYDHVQTHDEEPNRQGHQVEPEVVGNDVALVTLTMGGNDLDFADLLGFCAGRSDCHEQPYKGEDSVEKWISSALKTLRGDLSKLYGRLHTDFPNARILVLGYPALFPEAAPPASRIEDADCTVLFNRWTAPEREAIRRWGVDLNTTIQAAIADATNADGAPVEFVEVHPHFTGHEPCTTQGEWVRFVGISTASAIRDGSFHPLPRGQAMLARIVSCHLAVYPTADEPRTPRSGYAMTGCLAQQATLFHQVPQTPTPEIEPGRAAPSA